jgi:hypothetical protein
MLQDTATVIVHPMCHANTVLLVLAAFMRMSSAVVHAVDGSILNALGGQCTEILMVVSLTSFLVGMHLLGCQFPCPLQHRVTHIPPSGVLIDMGHASMKHNLSQILNGCDLLLVNVFYE